MPTLTKKFHGDLGRLVIINLQPTKQDKKADLIIRKYADVVMEKLFQKLEMCIPEYDPERDPILKVKNLEFLDWTQSDDDTKTIVAKAEKIEAEFKAKRKEKKVAKLEEKNGELKKLKKSPKVTQNGSANHFTEMKTDPEESDVKNEEVKPEIDGFQVTENGTKTDSKVEHNGVLKVEHNGVLDLKNTDDGDDATLNESLIKTEEKDNNLKRPVNTKVDIENPIKVSKTEETS